MSEPLFDLDEKAEELLLRSLPLLREVARTAAQRWRLTPEDAEDLLSEVQLKLLENDGEALRSCHQTDRLRAFLATTVARHLLDRRNHEWGKWRPCAEARRQGRDAEWLDRLLNRDGLPFDQVAARLRERGIPWDRGEIEKRAALFPARARRRRESDENLAGHPVATASPEQALLQAELARRRDRALALLEEARAAWPAEEALMLRSWLDGNPISTIARQLDLPLRPLYRRFEALFERQRIQLEKQGIGRGEVKEILALDRWENELPAAAERQDSEVPAPGPSESRKSRILPS